MHRKPCPYRNDRVRIPLEFGIARPFSGNQSGISRFSVPASLLWRQKLTGKTGASIASGHTPFEDRFASPPVSGNRFFWSPAPRPKKQDARAQWQVVISCDVQRQRRLPRPARDSHQCEDSRHGQTGADSNNAFAQQQAIAAMLSIRMPAKCCGPAICCLDAAFKAAASAVPGPICNAAARRWHFPDETSPEYYSASQSGYAESIENCLPAFGRSAQSHKRRAYGATWSSSEPART